MEDKTCKIMMAMITITNLFRYAADPFNGQRLYSCSVSIVSSAQSTERDVRMNSFPAPSPKDHLGRASYKLPYTHQFSSADFMQMLVQ